MSKRAKITEELLKESLVSDEEHEYEIPSNWIWTKFGTVAKLYNGYAFKSTDYQEDGIPIIRISDIANESVTNLKSVKVSSDLFNERFVVKKDDLLIAMSGATTGKTGIYHSDDIALQNQRVGNIKEINHKLLYYKFKNYFIFNNSKKILGKAYGGAQPNISGSLIESLNFPLPPLAEQKRIAEKVERLLDKVEEAKRLIEEAKETFELRRAAIIDKAFRGELTNKITNNRDKDKDKDQPYILPSDWKWTTIGKVSSFVGSGSTPKGGSNVYQSEGIPFIRSQNVLRNSMKNSDIVYISEEIHEKMKRTQLLGNETLLNITGASIGRASLIDRSLVPCNINQHVCAIRFNDSYISHLPQLWLNSPYLQKVINSQQIGATRQALNFSQVKNLPIPLIPLKEQSEMLSIIDVFLRNEEKAFKQLPSVSEFEEIKKSIISKAFRGELDTNDLNEESAIELLKSVLQERTS